MILIREANSSKWQSVFSGKRNAQRPQRSYALRQNALAARLLDGRFTGIQHGHLLPVLLRSNRCNDSCGTRSDNNEFATRNHNYESDAAYERGVVLKGKNRKKILSSLLDVTNVRHITCGALICAFECLAGPF
jgi:hypothetical protein